MASARKTWSRVLAVVTLVLITLLGYYFDEFRAQVPWLTNWQFRAYNALSKLEARRARPKFVVGVEYDDQTFYGYLKEGSGAKTNRNSLAQMIDELVAHQPALIAIDIRLSRDPADDVEPLLSQNKTLLRSIEAAAKAKVPVVLTRGLRPSTSPSPNIYADDELPAANDKADSSRTRVGFDNASFDLRKAPLVVVQSDGKGGVESYPSFSLEIVDAYESHLGIKQKTVDRLARPIALRQFVFTTFLDQSEFPHISGQEVLKHNELEVEKVRNRIALIGGNRHDPPGSDAWLDDRSLPPFEMRGMYVHANYVEGLLDDRILSEVPNWMASLIDLTLGILMLYFAEKAKEFKGKIGILALFIVPIVVAYIASANLGYVLDFVLPLLLLFVHAFAEHYLHLRFPETP